MLILFILFVCFLLALGYVLSENAIVFTFRSLVGLGAITFITIAGFVIWSLSNTSSRSSNIPISNSIPNSTLPAITEIQKNNSEKCVTEYGVKICDLKYSSKPTEGVAGYRDVLAEGNSVSCVNMSSNEITTNDPKSIRVEASDSFCVSDFGYVYIDPSIQVMKYWNIIKRDSYTSPYYLDKRYDTCIWTWEDGSGRIPYMETFGNIGPRSGDSIRAFCKNGQNEVDIYSYERK